MPHMNADELRRVHRSPRHRRRHPQRADDGCCILWDAQLLAKDLRMLSFLEAKAARGQDLITQLPATALKGTAWWSAAPGGYSDSAVSADRSQVSLLTPSLAFSDLLTKLHQPGGSQISLQALKSHVGR